MKQYRVVVVEGYMTTQMATPMTIKEYAACHGLSETTIRRRIRAGWLDARLEHGRYFIYGQKGVHSGEEADRQNGKEHAQFEQADAHQDSQTPHVDSLGHTDHKELIDRLTSEVDYLRGQLDKQTHLLAASTSQNTDMMKKLSPPPQPSWFGRIRQKFLTMPAETEADS